MTKPLLLADLDRMSPAYAARLADGLHSGFDMAAARAPASHGFLGHGWFAAALAAYGGTARTLLVEDEAGPAIALPLVDAGPRALGLARVLGHYWPFRSFPAASDAEPTAWDALVREVSRAVRGLVIGPVYDDDPAASALLAAARARGWATLPRFVATGFRLDLAGAAREGWPRGSTLRKNRFHEKHLGAHGAPDWRFLSGADWPAGFEALAAVERASWVETRTDGRDAKFTDSGHGAFWRAAARDPVLADAMSAALLTVDGRPAAFSFDLDAGDVRYAIANSYDPAFAKHSPGKLLQYRNLVRALEQGIATVDWGAGDSGYKQVIGATAGPALRDWLLLRPGLPATAGRWLRARWGRSGNVEPVS